MSYLFCWAQGFSICFFFPPVTSERSAAAPLSQSKSLILHIPVSTPVWHSHSPGEASGGGGEAGKSGSAQGRGSALTPEQVLQLPERIFCHTKLLPRGRMSRAERVRETRLHFLEFYFWVISPGQLEQISMCNALCCCRSDQSSSQGVCEGSDITHTSHV